MTIIVNPELCRGCGVCKHVCPNDAIYLENRKAIIDQSKCSSCQLCIDACPFGAIKIEDEVRVVSMEKPQKAEIVQTPVTVMPSLSKSNWGKTLSIFATQQVLPRLLDILGAVVEQKINPPAQERSYEREKPVESVRYGRRRQRRGNYSRRNSRRM